MTSTSMWSRHAPSEIQRSRDLTDHARADEEQMNLKISSSLIIALQKLDTKPMDF